MLSGHAPTGEAPDDACRNCGLALGGNRYCGQCGQSAHAAHALSLGHFAHELVHEVLHLDGTIWRTLGALLFQPGKLTSEYWSGRIAQWIRPVRLFLTAVAAHVLLAHGGVGPLNFRLQVQVGPNGEQAVAVGQDLASTKLRPGYQPASPEQANAFFNRFGTAYGSLRYVSVLVFAAVALLLFRRRQPYYVSHLIFGLHFYTVWYLLALPGSRSAIASKLLLLVAVPYLFIAVRRAYQTPVLRTLLSGTVLYLTFLGTELALALAAVRLASRSG